MNAAGIAIFTAILVVFMALFIAAYGQVEQVLNLKSQAQEALGQALRDAASQGGPVLGLGNDAIQPDQAEAVFSQDINNWLANAPVGVTWQTEDFRVFQADMAGTPAPGNIPGNVPGPSVYARVAVSIAVLNIPLLQRDMGVGAITVTIDDMQSANRLNSQEKAWNGG
jgi:hypothetical protein